MTPTLPAIVPDTANALIQSRLRALVRLRAALALAVVLPMLLFLLVASITYQRAMTDADLQLERTAGIAREHALKLFETNQMLLQRMLDLVEGRSDDDLLRDGAPLHQRLVAMAASLPQVQGLFIFGADARVLGSSRMFPVPRDRDFADREWYRVQRDGQSDTTVFFTQQLTCRTTGDAYFDMSQRRVVDGRFAGTVNVSLRPEYLSKFYAELARTEPGLRMAVLRRDGSFLTRWPDAVPAGARVPAGDLLMQHIATGKASGVMQSASPFDGVVRRRVYQRLGDFPLFVVAAQDRAAVLTPWLQQMGLVLLFLVPTALSLIWSARTAIRHTRDELGALQRLSDETARRQRAEVALMQAQKLEALGRLTGGVAHDFNNLLAVVSSNVELLRRLSPQPAQLPRIDAITRSVEAGVKLTRQLLAFARKQALLPEQIQLQARLPAMLDMLRPLLGPGIELQLQIEPGVALVEVDPAELELALINVAVNAGDAMQKRGRLAISARNALPQELPPGLAGDYVLIDVDDSGPGIAPAHAAEVFEPFFTTKPVGEGTGLGLAQVRAFCQSASGEALVLAAPGGGARVRLLMQRSAPAPAAATPAAVAAPSESADLQAVRILLVEDNDEVAQATAQLLQTLGAYVTRVADAQAALDFIELRRTRIDVVLTDIQLPGAMDGISLASRLAQQDDPLPVVLITGYAQRLDEAVLRRMEVLPKPFTAAVLADHLVRARRRAGKAAGTAASV